MKNAPCKLCGTTAKLIRKSHVIPDFMYQNILGDSRKMILVNLKDIEKGQQVRQTGLFEKYILCTKCESLFSKLERYVSHVLYGGPEVLTIETLQDSNGDPLISISGLNYDKFKLCFLSILWRSHISNNVFFKNINISECADEIREMLLKLDAKSSEDYSIAIMGFLKMDKKIANLAFDPGIQKLGSGNVALFFISGYLYFINLKPESDFDFFKTMGLQKNGEIKIPLLSGSNAKTLLRSFGVNEGILELYFGKL